MGAITIDQPRKCRSPWSWSVQYRLLAVAKVHWRCLWARRDKCHVNWHKLTVSGARQARRCSEEIGWVGNFDLLIQRFNRGALWHRRRGMAPWQRAVSVLLRGHSTSRELDQFTDLANHSFCSILAFVLEDEVVKTRTWWVWTTTQIRQPTTMGAHLWSKTNTRCGRGLIV